MNFDDLLSRADEVTLQALLGKPAVRLITRLDSGFAASNRLREVLISLRTREGLILTKESRDLLFDLLKPKEAEILALVLQAPEATNAFQSLKSLKIRSGTERERTLFDFFELVLPKAEERIEFPSLDSARSDYSLFEHQRRAAREIRHQLANEPRRVLLHMPTGSGKTRTAMSIIADHLRAQEPTAVIWLAHSEELCEQAATEFQHTWQYLGDREVSIHRFWGSHQLDPTEVRDGIVVAGLSKVYRALKQDIQFIGKLGNKSSLVIIDEAHQAVAETYRLALDVLVLPYDNTALLGLTATPGRTWSDISADEELAKFFARRKVSLNIPGYDNPVDYLIAEKYLAKTRYRSLLYEGGVKLSSQDLKQIERELEIPEKILDQLAEDEQRNLKIILEIEYLAKHHKRILVFASSVEHSGLLASVLRIRGFNANSLTGSTPAVDRERIIRDYKDNSPETKILCNYAVLTTGFNAPQTSAAVIARPTKSLVLYSQMVGRATRGVRAGGNETAEIITIVDSELPGFGAIADAFNNWEDVWWIRN